MSLAHWRGVPVEAWVPAALARVAGARGLLALAAWLASWVVAEEAAWLGEKLEAALMWAHGLQCRLHTGPLAPGTDWLL